MISGKKTIIKKKKYYDVNEDIVLSYEIVSKSVNLSYEIVSKSVNLF